MIKPWLKTTSFLFAAFCFIRPAHAIITTDVAEGAARIAATIGDIFRGASKELDRIEQNQYIKQIGAGHKETNEIIKQVKGWGTDYAKQRLLAANPGYNAIPDNQEIIDKLEKRLLDLQTKEGLASAEQEAALAIIHNSYTKKIQAFEESNANLQMQLAQDPANAETYNWQIDANNVNIKLLKSEMDEQEKEVKAIAAFKNKDIAAEIKDIEWRSGRLKEQLANKVEEIFGINLKDPTASIENVIKKNYIPKGEKETAENVDEIRRRRLLERRNAYMSSYSDAVLAKQRVAPDLELLEELAADSAKMDTVSGSIGVDTQIKIKTIEMLMQYAELQVADLRVEAANAYAGYNFYAVKNPDRNVSILDLKDFVYNCEIEYGEK